MMTNLLLLKRMVIAKTDGIVEKDKEDFPIHLSLKVLVENLVSCPKTKEKNHKLIMYKSSPRHIISLRLHLLK